MVARGYDDYFFLNQLKGGSTAWNKVLLAILADYSDRVSKGVFFTWLSDKALVCGVGCGVQV